VSLRLGDLGLDGRASTVALARWLEDARFRLRFARFDRRVAAGGFGPYRILLVSQHVERHVPVGWTDAPVRVRTGIRRIGRTSFTFGQTAFVGGQDVGSGEAVVVLADDTGPLALPAELLADLEELGSAEPTAAGASRPGAQRNERNHYPFATPLRARVGDVDSNRHVNYIALLTWYDDALAAFAVQVQGDDGPLSLSALAPSAYRVQYIAEVGYPGDYEIGIAVAGHDAEAVHYELGLFRGDRCVGLADAIGARGELPGTTLDAWRGVSHANRWT
jgi:acyl-CoA thioester hydrolase